MPSVIIIHDFAASGWEGKSSFEGFWEWFRSAINDFIEFSYASYFSPRIYRTMTIS